VILAAAGQVIDGEGDLRDVWRLKSRLDERGLRTEELRIAPLRMPWKEPLPPGYLKGATAPLQAIAIASLLFEAGRADAVLLSGTDQLRSDYTPEDRRRLMGVFEGGETHLEGYARLAEKFIDSVGISKGFFLELAERLFENYLRTCRARFPEFKRPEHRWFGFLNEYFRGVDCANPHVDFSGAILVMSDRAAEACELARTARVRVLACELREAGSDSIQAIPTVVRYAHLEEAFAHACEHARIDFVQQFLAGEAMLEAYSCYPVVPLAFLLHSGLVRDMATVPSLLRDFDVTVSGGLNLARAPWNNTTLNSIVIATQLLRTCGSKRLAGIHGNGSLGYQQGFLLLGVEA